MDRRIRHAEGCRGFPGVVRLFAAAQRARRYALSGNPDLYRRPRQPGHARTLLLSSRPHCRRRRPARSRYSCTSRNLGARWRPDGDTGDRAKRGHLHVSRQTGHQERALALLSPAPTSRVRRNLREARRRSISQLTLATCACDSGFCRAAHAVRFHRRFISRGAMMVCRSQTHGWICARRLLSRSRQARGWAVGEPAKDWQLFYRQVTR